MYGHTNRPRNREAAHRHFEEDGSYRNLEKLRDSGEPLPAQSDRQKSGRQYGNLRHYRKKEMVGLSESAELRLDLRQACQNLFQRMVGVWHPERNYSNPS